MREPIFSVKLLEMSQIFKAQLVCLQISTTLRTDSVYEDTWKVQQFQSSKSLLQKNLNVFANGFILEISWNFQCLKAREWDNLKSKNFKWKILSIKFFELFQVFKAQSAWKIVVYLFGLEIF